MARCRVVRDVELGFPEEVDMVSIVVDLWPVLGRPLVTNVVDRIITPATVKLRR